MQIKSLHSDFLMATTLTDNNFMEEKLMALEMKMDDLNEVAGGKAVNKKYYNYVSNGWVPYTIQSGDMLSVLAANRKTTVSMIMQINPLLDNANAIQVGYSILLPPRK